MRPMFSAIYRYRGFIIDSVKRDFQARYQTSFLGVAWLILQPVAMISVYTLIFSELMRTRLAGMDGPFAYSIYLCSGVLTWGFFTEMLNNLVNIFLTHANILKKMSFPRICLPAIITSSAFINFLIIFLLFIGFLLITGNFPGWIFFRSYSGINNSGAIYSWTGDYPGSVECFCPRCWAVCECSATILVLVHTYCLCLQNPAGMGIGIFSI